MVLVMMDNGLGIPLNCLVVVFTSFYTPGATGRTVTDPEIFFSGV
jgi:K+-sensing histidine kinase KdpD